MKFRPCIDIHNGCVKQIVGSSLKDEGDQARENFVAEKSAADYAALFRRAGLTGGHVILLNGHSSPYYEATARAAGEALAAWPGGLQVGGGITAETAKEWIERGAGAVIVTSYVFREGQILRDRLQELAAAVGWEHVVLDLSCRRKPEAEEGAPYFVCTDRWQTFTDTEVTPELLRELSGYCAEFLIHGIAVEGKGSGIDEELVRLLGVYAKEADAHPVTYAGGVRSLTDILRIGEMGEGRIDYTVGSALDLYGGTLPYARLAKGEPVGEDAAAFSEKC